MSIPVASGPQQQPTIAQLRAQLNAQCVEVASLQSQLNAARAENERLKVIIADIGIRCFSL